MEAVTLLFLLFIFLLLLDSMLNECKTVLYKYRPIVADEIQIDGFCHKSGISINRNIAFDIIMSMCLDVSRQTKIDWRAQNC